MCVNPLLAVRGLLLMAKAFEQRVTNTMAAIGTIFIAHFLLL